jgi:hypothetical protein
MQGRNTEGWGEKVLKLLHDHVEGGVFDPHAVSILVAAFDAAWQSIKVSGAKLSDQQIELVQARHGGLDQCRLRDGALLHLAQSNLGHPSCAQSSIPGQGGETAPNQHW